MAGKKRNRAFQKQLFAGALNNRLSQKFPKICRINTCARFSFLIKKMQKSASLIKRDCGVIPCEFCKNFQSIFFIEHFRASTPNF